MNYSLATLVTSYSFYSIREAKNENNTVTIDMER